MHAIRRTSISGTASARRRVAALVGLAGLLAGLSTGYGDLAAAGRDDPHRLKVKFTTASGPPVSFAPACDSSGACLLPISGGPESAVTGDFDGTGVYAGAAQLIRENEATSSALATFTGSVRGCGKGTTTIRYDAHYAADRPHGGGGTWEIVAELGTGGLRDLTGDGRFTVGISRADLSGTNKFRGEIRC